MRQRSAGTAEKGYEEYSGGSGLGRETEEEAVTVAAAPKERTHYTPEQVARLAKESEFTQLLYISQKYMNKVFTPRECEVFAYLYDGFICRWSFWSTWWNTVFRGITIVSVIWRRWL